MVAGFCEDLDSEDEPTPAIQANSKPHNTATTVTQKLSSRDVVLTSDESDSDDVTQQQSVEVASKASTSESIEEKSHTNSKPDSSSSKRADEHSDSDSAHEESDTESAKQAAIVLQDQEDVSDVDCATDDVSRQSPVESGLPDEAEVETPKAVNSLEFEDLSVLEKGFDFSTGLPSNATLRL